MSKIHNHRERKRLAKEQLKKEIIPIEKWVRDSNGELVEEIVAYTNKYKQIRKTEKNNFNKWFERVQRSQEYGKKVMNIVEEENYNNMVREREEIEAKKLALLIELHGEDEGKSRHDKLLQKIQERSTKKI